MEERGGGRREKVARVGVCVRESRHHDFWSSLLERERVVSAYNIYGGWRKG